MRSLSAVGRVAAVGAVIAAIVLVGLILFGGTGVGSYKVNARFVNAGQLVKGNPVQLGGAPVGSVKDIEITDDGQAEIKLSIDDDHAPLRRARAPRSASSRSPGIANRYVDLTLPPDPTTRSPTAAIIETDKTRHRRSSSTSSSTRSTPKTRALPPGLLQGVRRASCATRPTRPASASST